MLCRDLFTATCRVWVELLVTFVGPCKQKNDVGNKLLSGNQYPSLVAKEGDGSSHARVRTNKLLVRVAETKNDRRSSFIVYKY